MPEPLTIDQSETLDFLRKNTRGDRLPRFREIAAAIGFSSIGTVSSIFRSLAAKGFLRRMPKRKWVLVDGVYSADELLREVHESGADLPSGLHDRINTYFGVTQ